MRARTRSCARTARARCNGRHITTRSTAGRTRRRGGAPRTASLGGRASAGARTTVVRQRARVGIYRTRRGARSRPTRCAARTRPNAAAPGVASSGCGSPTTSCVRHGARDKALLLCQRVNSLSTPTPTHRPPQKIFFPNHIVHPPPHTHNKKNTMFTFLTLPLLVLSQPYCSDLQHSYTSSQCCGVTEPKIATCPLGCSLTDRVTEQNAYAYYPNWGEYWEPVNIVRFSDGTSDLVYYKIYDDYVTTTPRQRSEHILSKVSDGIWRTEMVYNTTYAGYTGFYMYESIEVHAGPDGMLKGGYSLSKFSSCSGDFAYICEADHDGMHGYISSFRA